MLVRWKPSLRSRHKTKSFFAAHESRYYYYAVHLEPKSHAKSKKRGEQEKFKSRYNGEQQGLQIYRDRSKENKRRENKR